MVRAHAGLKAAAVTLFQIAKGTTLNQAKLTENIDRSVMMVTALSPVIALAAGVRCCPAELLDHVNYDAAGDDACVMVAERVRRGIRATGASMRRGSNHSASG